MVLDYVALGVVFVMLILITAAIVIIGSLPGDIARKRNHPWPAAVNVASWIGLAVGVLWPLALVWAYLPVPRPGNADDKPASDEDAKQLRQQVAQLQATVDELQSKTGEAGA